ncbi:MAG: hypothetical protein MUC56_09410 [Thermoanaerobaculales bacterium]|jgi:hypothetical protein|nr:hypothetical protein [Thermoanaerobaculales bacterium]
MKQQARAVAFLTVLTTAVVLLPPAQALTGDALSLEVLVNGRPLDEIAARGTTYVEAVRHAEYSLRLGNRTGRRLAVALAVDGLNTIDAKSGDAATASKWVLEPWQTVTIEGWQIDPDAARRFFFTSESKSYGAWLGEVANLGVIEAVAYRELVPEPPPYPVQRRQKDESFGGRSEPSAESQSAGKAAPSPVDDLAATGIGRRVDHRVTRVHLQLERSPAAHLRLRYEYRQQLVELGVLPSPEEEQALARRERARGFDGFDFAPDPWGGKR